MSETFIGMPGVVSDDANALAHTGGWRTTVTIPEDTLRWGPIPHDLTHMSQQKRRGT